MHILQLPTEIFHAILTEAARVRGTMRALRLRLVCKRFSDDLLQVMVCADLICIRRRRGKTSELQMWPWVQPYLTRRLRERRTATLPRLHAIQRVAEHFAADALDYEKIAPLLLDQVPRNANALRRLFKRSPLEDSEEKWDRRLFVAGIFLRRKTHVTWPCLQGANLAIERRVYDAAVRVANYDAIDMLLKEDKGPGQLLYYAIRVPDFSIAKYVLASPHTSDQVWYLVPPGATDVSQRRRWRLRTELLGTSDIELFDFVLAELQQRAEHEFPTFQQYYELLVASICDGFTDMVIHLLQLGVPTATDAQLQKLPTLIWHASSSGHIDLVRLLLDQFGRFWTQELQAGRCSVRILPPPLAQCVAEAARRGYASIVQIFLDYGAEPNSALVGAVEAEHDELVGMLIEKGAVMTAVAQKRVEELALGSTMQIIR